MTPAWTLRGLQVGDIGWVAHRQGILYAQEYGWDATFEAMVAEIGAQFVKNFNPAWENAWIAEIEGQIVGSVFLVKVSEQVAKLRMLYVEPHARGQGLGQGLTDACIAFARSKGYQTLTLWTNDILVAARRIYQAAGFILVAEENHRSFGHELVGQNWDLDLQAVPPLPRHH
jgi:GNAT superfamily N-acetyltransferase